MEEIQIIFVGRGEGLDEGRLPVQLIVETGLLREAGRIADEASGHGLADHDEFGFLVPGQGVEIPVSKGMLVDDRILRSGDRRAIALHGDFCAGGDVEFDPFLGLRPGIGTGDRMHIAERLQRPGGDRDGAQGQREDDGQRTRHRGLAHVRLQAGRGPAARRVGGAGRQKNEERRQGQEVPRGPGLPGADHEE